MHATTVLGKKGHETKPDISLSMLLFIMKNVLEASGKGVYSQIHVLDYTASWFWMEAGHTTNPVP